VARDIIVVGASAGGVEAVSKLISGLPENLPATVLVVIHVSPWKSSSLARIFNYSRGLPAQNAADGLKMMPGHVYVAPPDYHLMAEDSCMKLWRGPKENLQRPSINVLFRSAAVEFGKRVIGVVLTGNLDDGSAGLWWIKRSGGIAIVQDPASAAFPDMPCNALSYTEPDYVLRPEDMGPVIAKLTRE
jgi:two-component system, chemotaxis family, protein-glutamate methylesterase/glutaminase